MKVHHEIDLKPETIKSIEIYSKENNVTENEIIQKALDQFFDGDYSEFWDDLYEEAVKITKQYDKTSASLLQRELEIGYGRAQRILNELQKQGYARA